MAFDIQQPVQPGPVVVGANQPLVSTAPIQQVVTPDAVSALTDAYHKGVINASDIVDRIGTQAQMERKATIQKLGEFIDPDAIAARKAAIEAGGAQSNLAFSMAQAQQGLVGPRAAYDAAALAKQNAELYAKSALDTYQGWGNPPIHFRDKDGNVLPDIDTDQMSELGTHLLRAQNWMTIAQKNMQGEWKQIKDKDTDQPKMALVNGQGQDVSPGSEWWHYWNGEFNDAMKELHTAPKVVPRVNGSVSVTPPPPSAESTSVAPAMVEPAPDTPENNVARAKVATELPDLPGSIVAKMPQADLDAAMVQVALAKKVNGTAGVPSVSAPRAPTAATPVINVPPQFSGIATGAVPGMSPDDIYKSAMTHPSLTTYLEKQPAIDMFRSTVANYPTLEKAGTPTTQADISLANSVAQMSSLNKGARGVEEGMRVKKIEDAIPFVERLLNIKNIVLKNEAFPPEVRARLIGVGEAAARSLEAPASVVVRNSVKGGVHPGRFLGPEQSLLNYSAPAPAAVGETSGAPAQKVVTAPSGAKYMLTW
jgi:hypothetical protein